MKVILDIQDKKAGFVMELLRALPFVKTKTISSSKAKLIEEIKESVEEVNLIKTGKLKGKPVEEFLNEL